MYVYRLLLTAIYYFMAYTSGEVIDPAIIKPLTAAEFVANGNVTKMNDVTSYYTPYSGTTMLKQYSKQYSLVLTGDIKADVAVETLEAIKSVWMETTGMSCHITSIKCHWFCPLIIEAPLQALTH